MKKKKLLYLVLIILTFGGWLSWDISQANNKSVTHFKSFKLESDFDAVSSATTKVSIVRSDDGNLTHPTSVTNKNINYQTIEEMVREAIELAGGLYMVSSGDMVLLKPNIVDSDPSGNGEITDVRVIKALIKIIDEVDPGNIEIVVAEASPVPIDYELEYDEYYNHALWGELWDVSGYQDLLDDPYLTDINFRLSNLNCATPGSNWSKSDGWPKDSAWKDLVLMDVPGGGEALPQGGQYMIHKDIINADVFITVPVMKIHTTGLTVALKNQIGLAPSTVYGFWKQMGVPQNNYSYKLIHEKEAPVWWTEEEIVDLCSLAGIDFVVVDAIACLDRAKDARSDGSNLVRMNTILAGTDPVAVDHISARLMGLNPDDIEHITLAEKVGLGTNNPENIIIKGADLDQTKKRFRKSYFGGGEFGQGVRTWLLNGPYSIAEIDEPIDYEFIADEKSLIPHAGEDDWSEATYFIDNRINLDDYFNLLFGEQVVAYAACYFTTPKDQVAELWIGSDEAIKVFVNGKEIYRYNGTRSFPDEDFTSKKITFNLKKGENRLLVKTLQKFSRYDFCLNICEHETNSDYDGNRIEGLKFSTETTLNSIPHGYQLSESGIEINNVYPNPFSSLLNISYSVTIPGNLDISIYNLMGQKIQNLYSGYQGSGNYTVHWNANNDNGNQLIPGMYFIKVRYNNEESNHSILFL